MFAVLHADPISLHPRNPHYFLFAGKPTVLVTSGEHYGALLNRDFDYVRYFTTLQTDRLNLTRVFSGSYREVTGDFSISSNTLAPGPGKFIAPWRQTDGKFDLTRWDDAYFARLKDFMAQAAKRGIVVEFVLFCPMYRDSMWNASPMNAKNNANGIGDLPREAVLSLKDARLTEVQDAMVRKIVTELRDFDNLYYEICNEPYAVKGTTAEWQEHISKVIVETESRFKKKHLISQNWSNGSSVVEKPNPLIGLFNFHYSRPPSSVSMNWALGKAIGNNETGFDGAADATYRIQGWEFMLAGGALYNNLDYSFTAGNEDGKFKYTPQTPGGGSVELRRQLGHLRRFFDTIPFLRMQPARDAVASVPEGASVQALAELGRLWAAYIHHGRVVKDGKPRYQTDATTQSRQITFKLPPGKYAITWHDTKSGQPSSPASIVVKEETTTLTSPPYSEDIAVLIARK